MEKYRQIPATTFKDISLNGILAENFNPADGTVSGIMGATSGGVNFNATLSTRDFGEDIDNCPKNMMELKKADEWDIKVSGSFTTSNYELVHRLVGAGDVTTENGVKKITPRSVIDVTKDFLSFWLLGDHGDVNTGSGAGFLAIKIENAFSTGGFQVQSADKDKWKLAFEFTAHVSMNNIDHVPFEAYVKDGTAAPGITISTPRATVAAGGTVTLTATTYPANSTVTWSSNDTDVATVSGGVVTGVAAGYAVITASITESSVTYTEICTVTVTPAAA